MRCRGRLNLQQTCSCSLQGDTARCLARPLTDPNVPHDRVDDTAAIALERLDRPDAAALALLRDDPDRPLVACGTFQEEVHQGPRSACERDRRPLELDMSGEILPKAL